MTYGGDGGGVGEPFRLSGIESGDYPARVRSTESNTGAHLGWGGRCSDGSHFLCYGDAGGYATVVDNAGMILATLAIAWAFAVAGKYLKGEGTREWRRSFGALVLSLMVLFQWWHILLASTRYPISDAWINAYRKDCMDSTKARRAARTIARARESIARERSSRRALSLAARAGRQVVAAVPGPGAPPHVPAGAQREPVLLPRQRDVRAVRPDAGAERGADAVAQRSEPGAVARADATPVDPPVARADRVHRHPARAVPVRRGRDLHRRERQGDLADPQLERACVCRAGTGGGARPVPPREPRPRADSPSGPRARQQKDCELGRGPECTKEQPCVPCDADSIFLWEYNKGPMEKSQRCMGCTNAGNIKVRNYKDSCNFVPGRGPYCLVRPGSNEIQPCQQCCTEMQPKMYEDQLGRPFCV